MTPLALPSISPLALLFLTTVNLNFCTKRPQFWNFFNSCEYAWHFPWFLIPCEERGKKWNSLSRNEENSRNFFTSNEHLIYPKKCTKNLQNFFLQKNAIFFVKGTQFSTPKQFLLHFYASIFFRYKILHFFQFLRPILAKKPFILGWWIPCFPCLFSLWGIPCHQIPWFLVPHEEMPCVVQTSRRKKTFIRFILF